MELDWSGDQRSLRFLAWSDRDELAMNGFGAGDGTAEPVAAKTSRGCARRELTMSASGENIELIKKGYDALQRQQFAWLSGMDDD